MDLNIQLRDELSIILLWIGLSGVLDEIINISIIFPIKIYIYALFILIALYLKLD
jgi:hypothetical protein